MTDKTWQSDVSNWVRHQGDPSDQTKTNETIKKLLAAIEERHLRYSKCLNPHFPYFPVPLVGLVLQQMHEARPDAFSPLHIVARGIRDTTDPTANGAKQFIVWLPREDPRDDEPNVVWDPTFEPKDHPDLFIARYVAAMVIGQAVSFAPKEIVLDYYSKATRDSWSAIIERALRENGWKVMEKYLEQVRCEPARIKPFPEIGTADVSVSDQDRQKIAQGGPLVLGIDIGGTSIKIQLYKVTDDGAGNLCWAPQEPVSPLDLRWEDLQTLPGTNGTKGDWPKSRGNGLSDVSVLMEHLTGRAINHFGRSIMDNCKAVGISIAAPVSGGVPTAISGVLAYIQGFTDEIVEGNPQQIHQLDFAAALANGKDWTVVCLNDGEADILDSDENVSASAEGVSLVLKEGTGVAFAVHVDGGLLGIPGETAKAVLNLRSKPQTKPIDKRFQAGVVSQFCSQKAFSTLLPDQMWSQVSDEANPGKIRYPTEAEKGKWLGHQCSQPNTRLA